MKSKHTSREDNKLEKRRSESDELGGGDGEAAYQAKRLGEKGTQRPTLHLLKRHTIAIGEEGAR